MMWVKQKQYQPPTTERKRLEHKKKRDFLEGKSLQKHKGKIQNCCNGGKKVGEEGQHKKEGILIRFSCFYAFFRW